MSDFLKGWLAGRERSAQLAVGLRYKYIAERIRALVPPAADKAIASVSLPAQPTAANPTAEPERKP